VSATSGTALWSLPNLLGLFRIAATPVVIALLLLPFPGAGLAAFVVFGLASISDLLDGRIARARRQVNSFGVFMDLTADKVLVAGILIAAVEVGLVPTWIAATIIVRELVVAGIRQLAAAEEVVIAARGLGKAKTLATLIGLGLLLLAFDGATGGPMAATGWEGALRAGGYWVMVAAALLAIGSGLDYLRGALPILTRRG
jgi:CDP-diacylglycerol--glycerol-3-phosphate 3-phosphatidyltransferase